MEIIKLLQQLFGKASMLAKLSIIFNIILGYTVLRLHKDEKAVNSELIKVHIQRYDDMRNLLVSLDLIKKEVKKDETSTDKIEKMIESVQQKAQDKILK